MSWTQPLQVFHLSLNPAGLPVAKCPDYKFRRVETVRPNQNPEFRTAEMKVPTNCCKNCHFLNKTAHWGEAEPHNASWSEKERENLAVDRPTFEAPNCWHGIWDTGINPNLQSQLTHVLTSNRKDECFFIEFRPGMSYQAATDLHRIRNDNRQLKTSYRYTRIALGVAAAGIVLNFVWNIVTYFF